jgi:hypothetical protein
MIKMSIFAVPLATLSLVSHAAQAQSRVFVAAQGSHGNPCTFASPCRTFQIPQRSRCRHLRACPTRECYAAPPR